MPLLTVTHLTKYYGKDVLALSDVSFTLERGEFTAVIGPSGSGKTTLIRCINRLIDYSSGEVSFNDEKHIHSMNLREIRKARTQIGMIFQHYNLVSRLSVIQNVLHGRLGYKSSFAGIFGIYSEKEKEQAVDVLKMLGLEDKIYRRCDQLSGGQKQRVGIARALVQEPQMILCDEPISSLDPSSSKRIMDYLMKIRKELGITVFVNLHQVDVAKKYAERILGFNSGRLVFDGPPGELNSETIREIYGTEANELILN